MTEFHSPYSGFRCSDGRIFTAQAVHSLIDRHLVTVCASQDDAKRLALQHEESLRQQ